MGLLFLPIRALDSSGDPLSGAKLKFYAAGTSTPKSAYPSEADAVADTNGATEYTADGNGLFSAIYGDNTADYKIELTTSADVQIWEEDSVPVIQPTAGDRVLQGFRSPLDYEGIGDGAQDETTEVQAAIDAAETAGTDVVDLLGLTWRCDSQITIPYDFSLVNGKLDFTNCTDSACILVQGTQGATGNPSANLTIGDASVTTAGTAGMSEGKWVHMKDTSEIESGDDLGILAQIRSVSAGSSFTMYGDSPVTLTTANAFSHTVITPKTNIQFRDLVITGGSDAASATILLDMCDNVRIENCFFDKVPLYGIEVRLSANVTISNCIFGPSNATTSIGVGIRECSRDILVQGCHFKECDNGIGVGGFPASGLEGFVYQITIRDCRFTGCAADNISDKGPAHKITIDGCYFEGEGTANVDGIALGSGQVSITNNDFYLLGGAAIAYNDKTGSSIGIGPYASRISGNTARNCASTTQASIGVDSDGKCESLIISDNTVDDAGDIGIGVLSTSVVFESVSIVNNVIRNPGDHGISLDGDITSLVISGNHILNVSGGSSHGIVIDVNSAAEADGCYCSIFGNVVELDSTGAGTHCIDINGSETKGRYTVVGNVLLAGDYAISAGTTDHVQHVGNSFSGQGSGVSTGTIDAATVHGTGGAAGTIVETT